MNRLFAFAAAATMFLMAADGVKLGKPLTLKDADAVSVNDVLGSPDKYVNKPVLVKGKVTEVCKMMGCWMALAGEGGKTLRVKVNDGEIVFPKTAIGKTALAEGVLQKKEMSKEQAIAEAKHEAEERGRKFDPASVTGPVVSYQIKGSGAVLLN
jgi:hypothetical protein